MRPSPIDGWRRRRVGAPTADERFRRRYAMMVRVGLIVAVAVHFGVLELFPVLRANVTPNRGRALLAVRLPPEVRIPPPPDRIVEPALPQVAEVHVDEDVTIAPTTFAANPVETLPPPPKVERLSDRPVYIPRDVDPRLQNPDEVLRLLDQMYPSYMKQAGIGGRVVLWLWVDERGLVLKTVVGTSSGLDILDKAAARVASSMKFRPALNRDKPIAVWIAQPITFTVKR